MISVALDTNLLLLLVVGRVAPQLVARHKRLRTYLPTDFLLLVDTLRQADSVVTTPNALTEVSNLAGYGMTEPLRSEIYLSLRQVIDELAESYRISRLAAREPEFTRLGLCDAVWLGAIDRETILVTDDLPLYRAALDRGIAAFNFAQLREERRSSRRRSRKGKRSDSH